MNDVSESPQPALREQFGALLAPLEQLDAATLSLTPNPFDLVYTYETSTDLNSWIAVDPVSLDITPGDTEFENVHVHIDLAPNTDRLFFRVVVTQP